MIARHVPNYAKSWVKRLLLACSNDIDLATRQIAWLKEKVVRDFQGDPSKPLHLLSKQELMQLEKYIKERIEQHKPLQYILGDQPFCELDIVTRPPTLIPRWETEEWTYKLVDIIKTNILVNKPSKKLKILEFCTGSGCISLALAKHLPEKSAEVTGLDISFEAIVLARDNLNKHQQVLRNDVHFARYDVFSPDINSIMPKYNLVVANPPYVTHEEYKHLDLDVKDWEDKVALVADDNGTSVLKRIIQLSKYCNPVNKSTPYLFMEIGGTHQVPGLKNEMLKNGFRQVSVWKDLADKDRVITGY